MKKLFALMLFLASGIALASGPVQGNKTENGNGPLQDHTCQGGHNCNGGAQGGNATAGAIAGASASAGAVAGASNETNVLVGQSTNVGVGVKNENSDFNSNTNVAYGGRGGDGGNAYAKGGDANQSQGQVQGQHQGQSQGQSQSASANNAGNTQSTEVNFNSPDSVELRQTVSSYAPPIYSSNACTVGGSFGGSNLLGSISIGGTKTDKGCSARENARIIAGMGYTDLALMYLCANEHLDVGATLGSACRPPEVKPEPPVVLPPVVEPEPEPPVEVIDTKVKG